MKSYTVNSQIKAHTGWAVVGSRKLDPTDPLMLQATRLDENRPCSHIRLVRAAGGDTLSRPAERRSSRKNREAAHPGWPVHREVTTIERQDAPDLFALRSPDQRGIGKIHRQALVAPHELTHTGSIVAIDG